MTDHEIISESLSHVKNPFHFKNGSFKIHSALNPIGYLLHRKERALDLYRKISNVNGNKHLIEWLRNRLLIISNGSELYIAQILLAKNNPYKRILSSCGQKIDITDQMWNNVKEIIHCKILIGMPITMSIIKSMLFYEYIKCCGRK